MRRLGRVLHLSQNRTVIIKVENAPRIGETVVDENLKPVGKILDVFGPVSSAYASMQPKTQNCVCDLDGKMMYVFSSKGRMEKT